MKIMYSVKRTIDNYEPQRFTLGKTYNVIADYTKRTSGQVVADNGYVIQDDLGENRMVFANEITVVDSNKENTYIFDYNKEV